MPSLRKSISVASVPIHPRLDFHSTTARIFRRTRKTVKRNVLKLGREAISGDRHKPKPTFRNSTHSPRLPIAEFFQFSATLRSINIQVPKNCLALVLLISISKSVPSGSNFSYLPKKYKIFLNCCRVLKNR